MFISDYTFGLKVTHTLENKVLFFNGRNKDDRDKFLEDLQEAIMEVLFCCYPASIIHSRLNRFIYFEE